MKKIYELFKAANSELLKIVLSSKLMVFAYVILLGGVGFASVISKGFISTVIITLVSTVCSLVFMYIFTVVFLVLINSIDKVLYNEFNGIRDKINGIFSEEYYELDFSNLDKIPNLHKKIKYREAPDLIIMLGWKCKVNTRKDHLIIMLPIIGFIMVGMINHIISLSNLSILQEFVVEWLENTSNVFYLNLIQYLFLVIVYYNKLSEMSSVGHKIDFLIGVKGIITE